MSKPGKDLDDATDSADRTGKSARSTRSGLLGFLGEFGLIVVIALILSALLRTFLVQLFVIPSSSMEHTLDIGDRAMVVKPMDFHRGDVVVFRDPGDWLSESAVTTSPARKVFEFLGVMPASSADHLVKRVIGMPGDHVTCCNANGQIEVNGTALDESSYLYQTNGFMSTPSDIPFDVVVPADHIFVLGDHRNDSRDSRYHLCDATDGEPVGSAAFVPVADVTGPVVAIALPFSRATRLHTPETFEAVPDAGSAPEEPIITLSPCTTP
ncbi:signal peptidase I [Propionibacterium australiense]|uniref:Signal peptidase I n=1 Tax=Propionibacterium australiense TaxID=119981 RepID=A0A383S9V7_9ACTN|nr:signal peptidase I [Propionibacterium australiense]RLP06800.1 signal peptidase I [Propionibacterium australiense]RLP06966.1 signal peptidase I [Propionibacterium australiense]SYZ34036.1 Signal peptidase I [Propionibacterium australiense]VEH92090.1 Signal peptidase I P [Propionibacterium australiense]